MADAWFQLPACCALATDVAVPVSHARRRSRAEALAARHRQGEAVERLAAEALSRVGADDARIMRAPGRAPKWPPGFVGSVTHTPELTAVVAAPASRLRAIGIDAEPRVDVAVQAELLPWVVRDDERFLLAEADCRTAFTAIYSAKEAFFKCMQGCAEAPLDFLALRVTAWRDNSIQVQWPEAPAVHAHWAKGVAGSLHWQAGTVFCAFWVPED